MSVAIITGSGGLVGTESCEFFHNKGLKIIGIDNDYRGYYFGKNGSVKENLDILKRKLKSFVNIAIDIRNRSAINKIFRERAKNIKLVIHSAAQPSHDFAAKKPYLDFDVNAGGTLNLLEATRKYSPNASFIFLSTNKVYGDKPNILPLIEFESRWDLDKKHKYFKGVNEGMSIDKSLHSLFGVSKLAADILVQEYGKYFGLNTVVFRCGCIAGSYQVGVKDHGFLSYLVKCAITNTPYTIYGYKGKQVRDNIHSSDLVNAFWEYFKKPQPSSVYNIGGSRFSNCSVLEAIDIIKAITKKDFIYNYSEEPRKGDHKWWISRVSLFKKHYPNWRLTKNVKVIIKDLIEKN